VHDVAAHAAREGDLVPGGIALAHVTVSSVDADHVARLERVDGDRDVRRSDDARRRARESRRRRSRRARPPSASRRARRRRGGVDAAKLVRLARSSYASARAHRARLVQLDDVPRDETAEPVRVHAPRQSRGAPGIEQKARVSSLNPAVL
jgi:hypothetical protein